MAFKALTEVALFSGPTADRTAQLEECAIGNRWFDDDQGIYYVKTNAGTWIAEAVVVGTGAAGSSRAYDVATTITRPANATPYTANDVLGAAAAALDLGVLGPTGKSVLITDMQLEIDVAAIPTGMTTFDVALYSVTPPSAIADNAAFDIPAGDRASFLGFISLGTVVDRGSTLYAERNGINKQVKLAGTHLFAYLITNGGFTPAGNSEVYILTTHTQEV